MELIKNLNIRWKCASTPLSLHEQTFSMCFNRIEPKKSKVYSCVFNCAYYCGNSPSTCVFYAKLCQKTEPVFQCLWYGKPQDDGKFPKL